MSKSKGTMDPALAPPIIAVVVFVGAIIGLGMGMMYGAQEVNRDMCNVRNTESAVRYFDADGIAFTSKFEKEFLFDYQTQLTDEDEGKGVLYG